MIKRELSRWSTRVLDLERRITEQKRRAACGGANTLGCLEVLHLMEQTLENWRAYMQALEQQLRLLDLI